MKQSFVLENEIWSNEHRRGDQLDGLLIKVNIKDVKMEFRKEEIYSEKSSRYFGTPRKEIESLLPEFSRKILDVGCGSGATLEWIKEQDRCEMSFGIELFPDAAKIAKTRIDEVYIGSVESQLSEIKKHKFDLILLLDVLEHLVDPWTILKKLIENNLENNGTVIACIPNVRYYKVILPLLLTSEWKYEHSGVLDKTHLRFFTKKRAIALLEESGLSTVKLIRNPLDFSLKRKVFNYASFGLFSDFLTQQYVIRAEKCS